MSLHLIRVSLTCASDRAQSFSAQVTLELLRQSGGVPVVFATVTRTGHVMMEELTDAEASLDWELEALRANSEPSLGRPLPDYPTNDDGARSPPFESTAEESQGSFPAEIDASPLP